MSERVGTNEAQRYWSLETPYIPAAKALSNIRQLKIGDTIISVNTYGISSNNSSKGVIHNIHLDASPEPIMAVSCAPRCEHLTRRTLGATGTMLITFDKKKVSFVCTSEELTPGTTYTSGTKPSAICVTQPASVPMFAPSLTLSRTPAASAVAS